MFKNEAFEFVLVVFCESIIARIDNSILYAKNGYPSDNIIEIVNNRTGEVYQVPEQLKKLVELRMYVEEYLISFCKKEDQKTTDKIL